jgi:hypothetical protein
MKFELRIIQRNAGGKTLKIKIRGDSTESFLFRFRFGFSRTFYREN